MHSRDRRLLQTKTTGKLHPATYRKQRKISKTKTWSTSSFRGFASVVAHVKTEPWCFTYYSIFTCSLTNAFPPERPQLPTKCDSFVNATHAHVLVPNTRDTLLMWEEKDIQSASRQSIDRGTPSCAELALPLPAASVGTVAGMAYWGTEGVLEGCRALFVGKTRLT